MTRRLTIVLAAGGTGGHVFPAIAAAEALSRRGHKVAVATDGRGARFEGDLSTIRIPAASLAGGPVAKLAGAARIGLGVVRATFALLRLRADAVVGFGGYPSLPTMLAAIALRRPTLLHEQNAVLGRVNRLLARRVARIAAAFAAPKGAPTDRIALVGNPVRQAVADVGGAPYQAPDANGPVNLLIFGGSQGARVLSEVLPDALARLPEDLRRRLLVVQQCRPEDLESVKAAYAEAGIAAELATFFDDMPRRLGAAHLVVARAGASTVAELAAAGRPSLLIPFAAAMDDHQTANAAALVDAGAAWRVAETEATPERVADQVQSMLADPDALRQAAAAALGAARPNAAELLADLIETTVDRRGQGVAAGAIGGIAA